MTDLVSIATYDKIISFSEHATNKFLMGKISYEQFCNIEMMDLGYNPNNPKEVEEYLNCIENLKDELIDIIFVTCLQCNAEHPVTHMGWEKILCLDCNSEIVNPEKEV